MDPAAEAAALIHEFDPVTAQVHAALRVAAELRTANLLPYLTWEPTRRLTTAELSIDQEVVARLGLTPTNPNQEK